MHWLCSTADLISLADYDHGRPSTCDLADCLRIPCLDNDESPAPGLACMLACLALAAPGGGLAQAWPGKPVRIIVLPSLAARVDVVNSARWRLLHEQTGQTFIRRQQGRRHRYHRPRPPWCRPDRLVSTLAANDTTFTRCRRTSSAKLPFDHEHALVPVGAFVFAPMTVAVRADSKY